MHHEHVFRVPIAQARATGEDVRTGQFLPVVATAVAVIAIDRIVKLWVVEWLDLKSRFAIDVLPPWFNLRMAWNTGINFGLMDMGDAGRWILIALALAIVAGLIFWTRRVTAMPALIAIGAVVGGALGNVWDRLQYGAVADFLNFSCCGLNNPFAFNVADAAIFCGVIALAFLPTRQQAPQTETGPDDRA